MLFFLFFTQLSITFSFTSVDDGSMNRTYWPKKWISKLLFIYLKLPAMNSCEPVLRPCSGERCVCTYGHMSV